MGEVVHLQEHDEFILEAPEHLAKDMTALLKEIMEHAGSCMQAPVLVET